MTFLESKRYYDEFWSTAPKIMRKTDPDLHPRPVQYRAVIEWKFQEKGLILYGKTGTGKTRAAWILLEMQFGEGYSTKGITGVDFQNQVIARTKPGGDGDLDEFMDELLTVDVLLIDDLDKARFTPRVETELFNLIDRRMGNELPIIFTVNSMGAQLAAKMSDDTGPAIIRRMAELCEPVNFDAILTPAASALLNPQPDTPSGAALPQDAPAKAEAG